MRCLLIYDIPHDRTRTKVADACLDYGLARLQWSAFIGELTMTLQRELLLRVCTIIGKRAANILILPINDATWNQRRELLQGDPDAEREHDHA